ncbi:MAG: 6-pyruvoyltetrahydropterin/6-carboxytetrahydropterin synthase [Glaciecola sp.]|jgi:6-pyruvoyltetrahydropterin/6-carboxytetrahydropterin synthase
METWGIHVAKEYLKFSCAHFLIFPDGTTERLHGHNYRVYVDVQAGLSEFGLVIDFNKIKPVIRKICDDLDEHWLVPGKHHVLTVNERSDGVTEVRYKDLYYAAPTSDVIVMPLNNISSENLATWIGRLLLQRLGECFPDAPIDGLTLAVEETQGQRGFYRYAAEG